LVQEAWQHSEASSKSYLTMPEMDNPKTSRSTAKGKLTRMEKYVYDFTIDKKINDLTVGLKFLDEILKDLDKAQLRVEMMPGNVLTDEENDNKRNSFERRYCDVASKILFDSKNSK
jgi:ABC-type uncharacterized transport system ATPase subunit